MARFQVGDAVRLKDTLAETQAGRVIEEHTKGQVLEVTDDGYTVQFTDAKAAVEGITEDEIELDQ